MAASSPGVIAGNNYAALVDSHLNDAKRWNDPNQNNELIRITGAEGTELIQTYKDTLAGLKSPIERARFRNIAGAALAAHRDHNTAEGRKFEKLSYEVESAFQASVGAGGVRLAGADPKAAFTAVDVKGVSTAADGIDLFRAVLGSQMSDDLAWDDKGQHKELVSRDFDRIKLLISDTIRTLPAGEVVAYRSGAVDAMKELVAKGSPDANKLTQLIAALETDFQARVKQQ